MEKNFNSLQELYEYIKPALYSKKVEFRALGLNYVREEDIWNYLSLHDWSKSKNLTINDMVSDIMRLDRYKIEDYLLNMFKHADRELITNEEDIL